MLHDLALTSPLLILLFAALFTLVVDPFLPSTTEARSFWGRFGAGTSAMAILACAMLWKHGGKDGGGGNKRGSVPKVPLLKA